jgi:alpha-L-fucosidase
LATTGTRPEKIQTLIKIVAKNGNFLLGIGPDKTGELVSEVYKRLEETGKWMDVNSSAIYNTKPLAPYQSGKFCFTQSKDGKMKYAFYLLGKGEKLTEKLELPSAFIGKNKKVKLLGYSKNLFVKTKNDVSSVELPEEIIQRKDAMAALVFSLSGG